jgi:hypothetical protein
VSGKKTIKKIWRKTVGAELQNPAEKVLGFCSGSMSEIDCQTLRAGAVEVAVFLQSREKHPGPTPSGPNAAWVKIVYRSYHPKPFWFTRECTCKGGTLEDHDPIEEFEIPAGKTEGRPFRADLVVDGIAVDPGVNGGQVSTEVQFTKGGSAGGSQPLHFSVAFPSGRSLRCLCC